MEITAYCTCGSGEKKYLYLALKSVDFCSQKIFLSDGCSKESLTIAEELGWEIWDWTGKNSMCDRRNFAIGYNVKEPHPTVRNDWIVQVDDDEVFADNFELYMQSFLTDGDQTATAIAIDLVNIMQDTGEELTSTPLPRIFKTGRVHWEKDIQNEVVYTGVTGYIPVKMIHYGYGGLSEHWEKQWKRLAMNEERTRQNPSDLISRGYLINALAVCGDIANFERMLAHVTVAMDIFWKKHRNRREMQVVIERIVRHMWAVCANNKRFRVFEEIVKAVSEKIDWIVDVPFWLFICSLSQQPIDLMAADKYGRDYLKKMEIHLKPPILNIEVQSMGEELDVCKQCYELHLTALQSIEIENTEIRQIVAKGATWWKKAYNLNYLYDVLGQNNVNRFKLKLTKGQWLDYASDFQGEGEVGRQKILMEISDG